MRVQLLPDPFAGQRRQGASAVTYHRKSLSLLGLGPEDGAPLASLPASPGEWYARRDALALLERYSNRDRPVQPSAFTVARQAGQRFTVFMVENQGVCWWAFTEEGDDPPVYVNLDPPSGEWALHATCFSEFIYTRIFDFQSWGDPERVISGSGNPVSPGLLAELGASFVTEPRTFGWPGSTQHRFSNHDQRIVLWCNPDQADWHLSAASRESLLALYRRYSSHLVWHSGLPASE